MRYLLLLLLFFDLSASAQALRDINYSFLYEPSETFMLNILPVRTPQGWRVHYSFTLEDSVERAEDYLLRWDLRPNLSEKEGAAIQQSDIQHTTDKHRQNGTITLPVAPNPQILVAKILNNNVKRAWIVYQELEPNYPVNGYLTREGQRVEKPFIRQGTPVVITLPSSQAIVSYYSDDFPAAVPPFSEGMGRVSRGMRVDSTFSVTANQEITFTTKGLYLVQQDTSDVNGFAFRVEDDYPRLGKIESLTDPLIYVCTKQEFDRIRAAGDDKKAFDKVILNITGDTDRAKNFMRNYFRRVEWANYYFTSYKEGWKTDRGMIYMLFGLPDELFKFTDREVWRFNNAAVKATFNFVKSTTVFDPENYVLIRDKKFRELWYEKIDLWRNARF